MNRDALKERVRKLWLAGKSVSEIERELRIDIDLSDVRIGDLHNVLVDGVFEFENRGD